MNELFKGKVTPKDWMYVGGFAVFLAAVIAAFFVVVEKKQLEQLAKHEADYDQLGTQLADAKQKQENIDKLRVDMAKTQEVVNLFEKRLPSDREIRTLVTDFERTAREVEVAIDVSRQGTSRDQRKETIRFNVTAEGDFHQIATFINRLERDERFIKVTDLAIKEQKAGVSEATFTLSTYRFLQEKPSVPSAADAGEAS